jgi:hypothetical protein
MYEIAIEIGDNWINGNKSDALNLLQDNDEQLHFILKYLYEEYLSSDEYFNFTRYCLFSLIVN